MSFVSTSAPPTLTSLHGLSFSPHRRRSPGRPSLLSLAVSNPRRPDASGPLLCRASKSQGSPVKKRQSSGAGKRKKKSGDARDVEVVDAFVIGEDEGERSAAAGYHPTPLPKPPAGFVVDDQGRVVMASDKRLVTIVDPTNNFPLECVIRRIFRSSSGDECMLLCPADTPVQILKSTNIDGWSAVSDEDVESILPTAAFALAKIHMHLVYSGFCYTARGGFCYSEDDIFDFRTGNGFFSEPVYLADINAYKIMLMQVPASPANLASQYVAYASLAPFVSRDGHSDIADDGQDVDGLPTEGVEITCFHMDGAHYMIYTPSDPLLFVAVKDHNRHLQIADDDLLEDPCIISAIDEETEFNALVEEEAALLESLMGER